MGEHTEPDKPDYSDVYGTATADYLQAFPQLYTQGALSQMGQGQYAGLGQVDLAKNAADAQVASSDILGQGNLDLNKKYGDQTIDQANEEAQRLDPERWDLNKSLEKVLSDQLAAGSGTTADQDRSVNESVRGAQFARGNYLGGAPSADEVLAHFNLGEQMRQQRIQNANGYLSGNNPATNYTGVAAAGQSPVAFRTAAGQTPLQMDPNPGAQGLNFASSLYSTQAGFNAKQPTILDQVGQGVGLAGNLIGGVAGAAAL